MFSYRENTITASAEMSSPLKRETGPAENKAGSLEPLVERQGEPRGLYAGNLIQPARLIVTTVK
jgi:hypothetical protein